MARQKRPEEMNRKYTGFRVGKAQHRRLLQFRLHYHPINLQDSLELALIITRAHLENGAELYTLPVPAGSVEAWPSAQVWTPLHTWMKDVLAEIEEARALAVEKEKPLGADWIRITRLQDVGRLLAEHGLQVMEGEQAVLAQAVDAFLCTHEGQEREDTFAVAMRRLKEELGDGAETP